MRKLTIEDFVSRAREKHGLTYDYSGVEYVNNSTPVSIVCPEHGEFFQTPSNHLSGKGCKKCGINKSSLKKVSKLDGFIEKARSIFADTYLYDNTEYVDYKTKLIVTCKKHGDFLVSPKKHLSDKSGCPTCAKENLSYDTEDFVEKARKIHGNRYDYEKTSYTRASEKLTITCPVHGDFLIIANDHLSKNQGCQKCSFEKRVENQRDSKEEFVTKSRNVHGNFYNYTSTNYIKSSSKVVIECPIHGNFFQTPNKHLLGQGCPLCPSHISKSHKELLSKFIDLKYENCVSGILGGKREIDIYFPDKKLGVEINGVYYHSSKFKDKHYHQQKTDDAKSSGIRLIHLWSDENDNTDVWASYLLSKLGKAKVKVHARNTTVKRLEPKDFFNFLESTHLQGGVVSSVRYGLYQGDVLVSVAGFSKKSGVWYLDRFSSALWTTVVGGFSKLMSSFIREFEPEKIVTFSDMAYTDGEVYEKRGFKKVSESSQPRLYYTNGKVLKNRRHFQRKNIARRRPDIEWKPEKEMAAEEGFYQLWGCKTIRWELDLA